MGNRSSNPERAFDWDALCDNLASGTYKNVVVMCGAGISTAAGIPDFRTPSIGLYYKLRKYNLPYPEAIFESHQFRKDPAPFYGLVREIYPQRLKPTTTHKFFKLLDQQGILRRVYTQNIDALEFLTGLDEDKVTEAHGTFQRSYCVKCKKKYDLPWLKRQIFSPETNDGVPKCDDCNGVVRPDVVLFGEPLPSKFWARVDEDFRQCDLLLIFGTSLSVSPFNSLARPRGGVARVYINKTKPGEAGGTLGFLMGLWRRRIDFNESTDLILLGDCDDRVVQMCDKVGWIEELNAVTVEVMEP